LIWLTINPAAQQGWQGDQPKGAVRIELDTEQARPWRYYGREAGYPDEYLGRLTRRGFGDSYNWYVTDRAVARDAWVVAERTATGAILWERQP